MKLDVFSQFTPFDLSKASKDGKTYRVEGIASSEDIDESGEIIKQDGLDWSYCLKTGAFNLDHKNEPKFILGAPTEVYKTTVGGVKATAIRGVLYADKPIVKDVFETAKAMESTGLRRMGFSIEGRVLERDPRNPRIITKAKVLNVSITGNPCNQTATIEMIKSILAKENTNMEKHKEYADVHMSYKQSKMIEEYSMKLCSLLGSLPDDHDLPEWTQSKITKALDYLQAAYHYIDMDVKEKMEMDKFLEDKPMPKVEEGDDEGAVQSPEGPGIHPTMEEDDGYRTEDKPYRKDSEVGYMEPAQSEGVGAIARESLEQEMSSEVELSDSEMRALVLRILREYPELEDQKVMGLIHDIMERKSYRYKKK